MLQEICKASSRKQRQALQLRSKAAAVAGIRRHGAVVRLQSQCRHELQLLAAVLQPLCRVLLQPLLVQGLLLHLLAAALEAAGVALLSLFLRRGHLLSWYVSN
jgi:hypothetical protein